MVLPGYPQQSVPGEARKEGEAKGKAFEDKEHQLFGQDGFEKTVEEVSALERALGIDDLRSFTPSL
jgi:hypothetical protein